MLLDFFGMYSSSGPFPFGRSPVFPYLNNDNNFERWLKIAVRNHDYSKTFQIDLIYNSGL
jgi:hypothetical protein